MRLCIIIWLNWYDNCWSIIIWNNLSCSSFSIFRGQREITEDPKDMLLYHRDMPRKIIPDYLHKKKKHTGILQSLNLVFHHQFMTLIRYLQEKHWQPLSLCHHLLQIITWIQHPSSLSTVGRSLSCWAQENWRTQCPTACTAAGSSATPPPGSATSSASTTRSTTGRVVTRHNWDNSRSISLWKCKTQSLFFPILRYVLQHPFRARPLLASWWYYCLLHYVVLKRPHVKHKQQNVVNQLIYRLLYFS